MTIGEIAALLRRHMGAVTAVLAVAVAVGYGIACAPVTYQESSTLYFVQPPAVWQGRHGRLLQFGQSEIGVAAILATLLMSPQGQRQARSAGAAGGFDVAQVNSGSLQYPVYAEPEVSLTTSGTDRMRVRADFATVARLLDGDLAALQAREDAPARYRLTMRPVSAPSLQAESGSLPKEYGGLAVLTVIAAFAGVILMERRRARRLARSVSSLTREKQQVRAVEFLARSHR